MSLTGGAYLLAMVYLALALYWTSPDKTQQFFNFHGIFVVLAGTAVIALIAVPWRYIRRFFAMITIIGRHHREDSVEIIQQMVEAAEAFRVDPKKIKAVADKASDSFFKDALELLQEGYNSDEIQQILKRQIVVERDKDAADAKMFKHLGKYPPAMGLLGTVMGMIALLGSLGQEGAEAKVGPAMSVAMTATLYGIILANIVILPVADNLLFRSHETVAKRELIVEGIMMVQKRVSPVIIRQILVAHLMPHQRKAFGKLRRVGS